METEKNSIPENNETVHTDSEKACKAEKVLLLAILACAACILVVNIVQAWPYTMDDSFITFRYARNLAEGHGPVFNPGEPPAEGYTSFLWVLVMAVPHLLGLSAVVFAKVLGTAAAAGCAAVIYLLVFRMTGFLERGRHVFAALGVMTFCAFPNFALHAVSGMETALFTLLLISLFYFIDRLQEKPSTREAILFSLNCLLAGLARPEGNLVAVAAAAAVIFLVPKDGRRKLGIFLILLYVFPGGIYFLWRSIYYGHLFPLTFYAKIHPRIEVSGAHYTWTFLRFVLTRFGIFILLALVMLRRRALPGGLAVMLFTVFYIFPSHIMGDFWRFLIPAAPFVFVLFAVGVAALPVIARKRWHSIKKWSPLRIMLISTAVTVAVAFSSNIRIHRFDFRLYMLNFRKTVMKHAQSYSTGLENAHVTLGKWLADFDAGGEPPLLALGDAGAVPYFSRWRTVDTWGLNDPVLSMSSDYDTAYALSRKADVMVLISTKPEGFAAAFRWERELHAGCLEMGMRKIVSLQAWSSYYLWVMAYPESDIGKFLAGR